MENVEYEFYLKYFQIYFKDMNKAIFSDDLLRPLLIANKLMVFNENTMQYEPSEALLELIERHTVTTTDKPKEGFDINVFCKQYKELFPDVKHKLGKTSGRVVRQATSALAHKMNVFIGENFKNFKPMTIDEFTDLILLATKSYVDGCIKSNSYIQCSDYFIYRGQKTQSGLLSVMESLIEGNVITKKDDKPSITKEYKSQVWE